MPPENDDAEAAFRGGGEQGDAQSEYERGDLLARRSEFEAAREAYEDADRRGHAAAATSVGIGNADCETGQRGYPKKLNYFDPQGRNFATDQHTPGDQGPTFAGRPRVPAGETYARSPQTGPRTVYNPTNP